MLYSHTMKVWVSGKYGTDLSEKLSAQALTMQDTDYSSLLDGERAILCLPEAMSEEDYLTRFVEIMRRRHDVNPALYSQPRTPGLRGQFSYAIRIFLWRIMRYQHFWLTFHQNGINAMQAEAIDFENRERKRQIIELEKRVKDLEEELTTLKDNQSNG